MFYGDEPRLSEQAFVRDFVGNLPEAKARVLDLMQEPFQKGSADGKEYASGLAIEAELLHHFDRGPARSTLTSNASWPSGWSATTIEVKASHLPLISQPDDLRPVTPDRRSFVRAGRLKAFDGAAELFPG